MADESTSRVETAPSVPVAQPAVTTVVGEPVIASEPAAITSEPSAAAPTVVETPVAEPTTLLGAAPSEPEQAQTEPAKPEAEKPAELGKDTPEAEKPEEKKDESSQSAEPAPLPTYDLTLPEGFSADDAKLVEFTKDIAEFETLTKADHAEVQKFAQNLVERHATQLQAAINQVHESYKSTWEQQKNAWKEAFVKDPEIGGNRQETTINAAQQFIRTHGGSDAEQTEFRKLMEDTGLGNHPAMIRLLAKANTNMSEGRPLPAAQPIKDIKSKTQILYGKTG